MKKTLALVCSCLSLSTYAAYTGKVFVDANGNGRYDKGEKCLAGVAVSDGLNVVKTDSKGGFTLNGYEKTRFIFITTPSGYKTYNRHYIPVSASTGAYDFGVLPLTGKRIAADGKHSFIHISDTEIFNSVGGEGKWVKNLKEFAANNHVAFIIHNGDICYDKGLKEHIQLMNTKNMDCPVFYANGNHDLVKGKYGEELFESLYGPVYYSFNVGNVHYVVTPMAGGDYQPSYTTDQVARWLKNDLAQLKPGTPVVIFNHNLLTSGNRFIYGKKDAIDLNTYNLKGWFYGHWHNHYVHRQGKVLAIGTSPVNQGGIDHSTAAYRVMNVDKNGNLASNLRYTYIDEYVRTNVVATNSGTIPVSANLYSSTSYPAAVSAVFLAGNKTIAKADLKQSTDWTWRADMKIPARYRQPNKDYKLKLRTTARFANGRTATDEQDVTFTQLSTPGLSTDWTNLAGNPQHKGLAKDTLSSPLRLTWIKNVGANLYMSSPLIYKGNVYVASVDENGTDKCAVFALDGKTGRQLWRCPVDYSVRNTITIANGKVFAQDISGLLYMIDAATGKLLKRTQTDVSELPVMDEGLVSCGDTVYAGSGKGLCAVNARSGETIWKNTGGWNRGEGTVLTWSVGPRNLIAGVQWSAMYANDLRNGKQSWKNDKEGLRMRSSSPAVYGNLLYTVSNDSFFIIDAETGRIVVKKKLDCGVDVASTPLLTDKEIIFGTSTGGVMALDNQTLEKKWQFKTNPALVYTAPYTSYPTYTVETTPILSGKVVYVAASDGRLYGLNPHTGKQVWQQNLGAPCFATPAVSGNSLVVTDFGGNVYLFTQAD